MVDMVDQAVETMVEPMSLGEYWEHRQGLIEEALTEYINSKYQDKELLAMVVHVAVGGKRVRGIMSLMCSDAMGGTPQQALQAACAVELAHAASLVKDDIMDGDEFRRGDVSFFKRFGFNLGMLVPDIVVPHAMLSLSQYGGGCLKAIGDAWARTAVGQFLDWPKGGLPVLGTYEHIIGLKTAPLFEVACDLGVRAAKMDHLVNIGKDYGFNCGMAFQVFDDYSDMIKNVANPWETVAKGAMPTSMVALRRLLDSGERITEGDCAKVIAMGEKYLQLAVDAAGAFPDLPDNNAKSLLQELPAYCCQALVAEVHRPVALPVASAIDWGIAGLPQEG